MTDVDDYLIKFPAPQRTELERVRKIIKQFVPDAVESISYGIPAFKYKNQPLIFYSVFKNHLSLFPTSQPINELSEELKGYNISKGTIRYELENPFPELLIKKILEVRIKAINKQK